MLFWILSLSAVVPATMAVTARKSIHRVVSLSVTVLSIAVILMLLEAVMLGLIHLLLGGIVLAAIFLVVKKRESFPSVSAEHSAGRSQMAYFAVAAIFFVGSLFLLTNTNVWQYVISPAEISFAGLLSYLSGRYLLLFLLVKTVLLFLLVITIVMLQRKGN